MGYFLMSPLRRIYNNPEKILDPHVREGMHVLEVGPGMGFFSFYVARRVGKQGRLYCVDVQEKMLKSLRRRAQKAGVLDTIDIRLCGESSLMIGDLAGKIDFILAFAVVHEVPSRENLFRELYVALRDGGSVLVAEPKNHVTEEDFNSSLEAARNSGFKLENAAVIRKNHASLLKK